MTGHSLLQCPFFMYWQQFIFFLTRIFLQSCLSNFSNLFTGQLLVAKCSLSIPIPSSLIDVYFQLLFHLTFQHLQEVCGSIFSCGTLIFWDGSANSSVPLLIKFQRWCVASMSFIVKAVQVVGLGIFFVLFQLHIVQVCFLSQEAMVTALFILFSSPEKKILSIDMNLGQVQNWDPRN